MKTEKLILNTMLLFILLPPTLESQAQNINTEKSNKKRVGAVCRDGYKSNSTVGGACSNHGGVKYWILEDGSTEEENPNLPARIEDIEKEKQKNKKQGKKNIQKKAIEDVEELGTSIEKEGKEEQKERFGLYMDSLFFYSMLLILFQLCALLFVVILYMVKRIFR